MPLVIPTRKAPANDSFPTSPEGVQRWLQQIQPLTSGENQRLLLRGLRHSNRLENNNRNRVEVLKILEPAVDQVLDELAALYFEQPLPLPRKPLNAHHLASGLLRELSYAWKIVVHDTYSSLLGGQTGLRSVSIFHAMRVLGKTILHHSLVYAPVPVGLLQDANTLFHLAEESNLHNLPLEIDNPHAEGRETWTIRQAYVHVQMMSLACLQTHRRRQIPLLSDFLESISEQVELALPKTSYPQHEKWLAVHIEQDTPAQHYHQYAPESRKYLRAFNLGEIMVQIHRAERLAPDSLAWEMESSVLRRNSLRNLSVQLVDATARQHQRMICKQSVEAKAGLKEIHALLVHESPKEEGHNFPMMRLSVEQWQVINRSDNGMCLQWTAGRSSDIQVGELVSVVEQEVDSTLSSGNDSAISGHQNNSHSITIGTVVWISYEQDEQLLCGVELLADQAAAVLVEGTTSNTRGSRLECLLCIDQQIVSREEANGRTSLRGRTLIAPPHSFQESGSVRMHHLGESSDWLIKSRKRAAGGFDFFELSPRSIN